ncbi:MAG TPA: YbjQ family protein [bacterium]|nr:YbjQ family protein [bacterium]
MIIVTTSEIQGKNIVKTLGLVKGNTIRARHIGEDVIAALRTVIGGEISEYTKMLAQARDESLRRMEEDAQKLGANAIVSVRFSTSSIMRGAAELLAYGTAVVVE